MDQYLRLFGQIHYSARMDAEAKIWELTPQDASTSSNSVLELEVREGLLVVRGQRLRSLLVLGQGPVRVA